MAHSIKTVYVVHHSHTDIGYTDLQERVIAIQVNYIKTVLSMMRQPEYADFRWNCETLYCVEEFWKQASEDDRADFARFVKEGKIGISANYLNFNDLVNADVFGKRLAKWQDKLQPFGTKIHTAMAADVNGFSMGYRDAMIENGVEFFFTNVHCHHGMYPLYQNQNAFFWENASGQRLLVWNGEHYNLGNVLGLQPNHAVNWMMRNRLGEDADAGTSFSDQLHTNLDKYLTECETEGYSYDFIVTAVSGVFSDNAPPSAEIMETIRAYNEKYGQEVRVEMVSLQELYAAIAPKLTDAPVYRGDWTDWWANGVGSTPYAVKHYKDADHRWQLANRLDPDAEARYPALSETVQDNLMLYAEHTWGHSSTITNPYDTMVLNLDMRKNSYASKAHEAASLMLCSIAEKKGDMLRYYNTTGAVRAVGVSHTSQPQLIEFYIYPNVKVLRQQQIRPSPVHVELVQAEHIAPRRRAMLRTGAGVLLVGNCHDNHYRINHREHKQKAQAVSAPRQIKRLCQCAVQRIQQSRYFHSRLPAASHRQCRPPHEGQRQQPNPPRVLSSRRGGLPFFAAIGRAFCSLGIPCLTFSPQLRQNYGKVPRHTFRLDLRQICKQIALQCFPCHFVGHVLGIEFVVAVCQVTDFNVMLNFRPQHLPFPFGFRRTTRRKLLLHDCLM